MTPSTEPVSVKIYNTARAAPTPALNALATLLLLAALAAVVIGFLVYRYMTRSDTTTRTGASAHSPERCKQPRCVPAHICVWYAFWLTHRCHA